MKNNKGFTLVELLAVIAILAVIVVIATRTVLPYMSSARMDAFAIEASGVVEAAESAVNFYNAGTITLTNDENSCKIGNTFCFTVTNLIQRGIYKGNEKAYFGKILVDVGSGYQAPVYTLYLRKNSEFSIDGSNEMDYTSNGSDIKQGSWLTDNNQEVCDCTDEDNS